ncbi:polysaccharide biosynthesis C-terminal domain-containing protein [Acidipropionibacterium jensenii]|uniref:polysaccharide biosynthesis C-terminal domain-containing protein n=1 Tax=Acidipropionibacterium jensenii TaxID=1749 RepID=UPI003B8A6DBB
MLVSTLFGALIGLALIVPLLIAFGAAGAMWAVAVSQVLVVLVQLELVRRSLDGRC